MIPIKNRKKTLEATVEEMKSFFVYIENIPHQTTTKNIFIKKIP